MFLYFEMFLTFLKLFIFLEKLNSVQLIWKDTLEEIVTVYILGEWFLGQTKSILNFLFCKKKKCFALVRNEFYCCNNYKLLLYIMLI